MKKLTIYLQVTFIIALTIFIPVFLTVTNVAANGQSGTTLIDASKTAAGHWTRTFQWTIEKSVDVDTWTLPSGGSGTSTYTITVTKDAGTDSYFVDGQICFKNDGAVATENLAITDEVLYKTGGGPFQHLTTGTVDVSANPVLDPGESYCYSYSVIFTPVAGAKYKNTAHITITNHSGHLGTPFGPNPSSPEFTLPTTPTLINDSINVDDTNGGSFAFSASGSQSYTKTFTCDQDAGSHTNTATIRETGQSDSATVTVTCQAGGCTYTQGYWKNHPDAWPVTSLTLGTVTYTQSQLLDILKQEPAGNGLLILAHQLIAAKLNAANGATVPAEIATAIAQADALIGSLVIPPVGTDSLPPSQTDALTTTLDNYNNGLIGPGHCEEP